ncbi:hypothetical protein ACFOWE_25730 [Planomonospora corallina]|uniref:Uncharacterized protein n=1 Tax=Planomonospora corallina TaxID=1806052 RepID=A0ABV8IC51_9ACTN
MTDPAAGAAGPARQITKLVAEPEGILTKEADLLTGSLTVASSVAAGRFRVEVQPDGGDAWYEPASPQRRTRSHQVPVPAALLPA